MQTFFYLTNGVFVVDRAAISDNAAILTCGVRHSITMRQAVEVYGITPEAIFGQFACDYKPDFRIVRPSPVNPRVWVNAPAEDFEFSQDVIPVPKFRVCEFCGESAGFHHIACPIAVESRIRSYRNAEWEPIALSVEEL